MPTDHTHYLSELKSRLETDLFDRVIPFWMTHSADNIHGGYYNCLDRDGSLYDRKKYVWLQGRQAWMFSKLYNTEEARDDWLAFAEDGIRLLQKFARRDDGRLYFALTEDGKPVHIQRKIFSECFYVAALAEYSRASGNPEYLSEAHTLFEQIWEWSHNPALVGRPVLSGQTPLSPLSHPMILLNLIEELEPPELTTTPRYSQEIDECIRKMLLHVDSERKLVRENILADGSAHDSPEGRLMIPGHSIEAGWFLYHWAKHRKDGMLAEQACDMIRWSFDAGWDPEYGGLYYFLDAEGYSPAQLEWFMKLWWPHTEAIYALLLCYLDSGSEDDLKRLQRVDEYIDTRLIDPEHGEWYGYLDRQGIPTHRVKGAAYKGCFHVPRAELFSIQVLRESLT